MDKASAYGAGDCRFESCRVHWCRWHTCHQTRFDRFSYDYSPTPAMSWCFVVAKRKICPHSGSNLHASRCRNRNSYLIVYAPGSRQPGPEKKNVNRSKPRHFVNSSEPEKNNNNNLPWNWQTQLYMNMNDITLQTHCFLIAGERNNYYLQLHIAQKQKPYLDICPIWQTHYPSHARLRSLVPWKLQRSSTCKHVQFHHWLTSPVTHLQHRPREINSALIVFKIDEETIESEE